MGITTGYGCQNGRAKAFHAGVWVIREGQVNGAGMMIKTDGCLQKGVLLISVVRLKRTIIGKGTGMPTLDSQRGTVIVCREEPVVC
jgi:hypothetical protein